MTQTIFDSKVSDLIEREIRFAYTCAVLHLQWDPASAKREDELLMLENVIAGLRDYDLSSEILTDKEVEDLLELGTTITLNWPHGVVPVQFVTPSSSVTPAPPSGNTGKYPATVDLLAGEVTEIATTIETVPYSINLTIYNSGTGKYDDITSGIGISYAVVGQYYYIYLSSETALTGVKLKILY